MNLPVALALIIIRILFKLTANYIWINMDQYGKHYCDHIFFCPIVQPLFKIFSKWRNLEVKCRKIKPLICFSIITITAEPLVLFPYGNNKCLTAHYKSDRNCTCSTNS